MNTFTSRNSRVIIREVWAYNLDSEFTILQNTVKYYSYVSLDTEYPGVIYHPVIYTNNHVTHLSPSQNYYLMKANVDATNVIQLGLTLSDENGNLPHLGTDSCYVWQFNFKDFNVDKDLSNPASIELLKQQGINFLKNKQQGISGREFSRLFFYCFGPGRKFNNPTENLKITWVTFHGHYDIAYLLAMIIQTKLPYDLDTFIHLLHYYFGSSVYDLKMILKFQGLHGGLERMAEILEVDRLAGKHHQAGSDSLLTMRMFLKTKKSYFSGNNFDKLSHFTYMLFGLNLQIKNKIVAPYLFAPMIPSNQYYQYYTNQYYQFY
ncbi:putative CCR4-associated factor 1 homolog 11 [Apium graveolens]|uniref:putative CCR4-associated factor 1 homolog 11 n=1 Tax=Apium graveolens TaxID=4045 RepID=UPI003D7A7FF9